MTYQVALVSLGCAKNLVDSEIMMGILEQQGHHLVYAPEEAEVVIINTCGFIETAKEESIHEILACVALKESHHTKWVMVAGCLYQRYPEELPREIPEVDAWLGTASYTKIAQALAELEQREADHTTATAKVARSYHGAPEEYLPHAHLPRKQATLAATAYLKIADGCDNHCSYCIIPSIRGSYRSRSIADIYHEAQRLIRQGVQEICLIAQDTTRYGLDLYGSLQLTELCRELLQLPGLLWLRLLYCHPKHLTRELLELMGQEERLCSYLDLPLQHSEDRILTQMNRRVTAAQTRELIALARELVPDLMLRTTFIVGFPSETEEEFAALCRFIQEVPFDHLGVFPYSQEEGTPGAEMSGQVSQRTKDKRVHTLLALQQKIVPQQLQRWLGREMEVLVERTSSPFEGAGRFAGQAPDVDSLVLLTSSTPLTVGEVVTVTITALDGYDLRGVRSP